MAFEGEARRRAMLVAAAAAAVGAAGPAGATGFYLQEQSVKGAGRANSGEVADRGSNALWWNPAAIGGIERADASAGASLVLTESRLRDAGSTIARPGAAVAPVGGSSPVEGPVGGGIIPKLSFAFPLGGSWAAGAALTAPFGLSTTYGEDDWARYSALESSLTIVDAQPSLAFSPSPKLSLGIALNLEYAKAELSNALPNLAAGLPDGRIAIEGDGWDWGWSAGIQLRPSARLTLGLAYKSTIDHRLNGNVTIAGLLGPLAPLNSEAPLEARFSTPSQLVAGVRWQASKRLTLNLQVARLGWSAFDTIELGPPLAASLLQGYRDGWSVGAGADYQASPSLTLRAGVQWAQTPIQDSLRDPKVPDSDRISYGAGASLRATRKLSIDAAISYVDLKDAPVSRDEIFYAGTPVQTLVRTRGGTEASSALLLSLGASVEF